MLENKKEIYREFLKRGILIPCLILAIIFKFLIVPDIIIDASVKESDKASSKVTQKIVDKIPKAATEYIVSKFDEIIEVSKECSKEFGLSEQDLKKVYLGVPFIVYDLDDEVQDQRYYYPIMDRENGKVVLVVTVLGTSVGWQHSIGQSMVKQLNELNWPNDNCLFYESDGQIVAQTANKKIPFSNAKFKKAFGEKDFEEKYTFIKSKIDIFKKISVKENLAKKESIKLKGTGYTEELGYYWLHIDAAQGQGYYGLCWAASLATIINYIQDSNLTAKQIADRAGIGYNDGATMPQSKKVLKQYGINYVFRNRDVYFKTVTANIQKRKPLAIAGWNAAGTGHQVTIYGYKQVVGGEYLMIWDSAANYNEGSAYILPYIEGGTTYSVNNTDFTWGATLSYK